MRSASRPWSTPARTSGSAAFSPNRTIKIYPAFAEFYGMEDTIERIVGYFRYASQGLEERKQILYLLGPVGGGKSSLAERLKKLMEMRPIYTLKVGNEISPVFESPLGLFHPERMADLLEDKYGIARRRLNGLISPWAAKRLDELARRYLEIQRRQADAVAACARSASPRPSQATRTTRTSRRWSARSTSGSWRISASPIRMPIPTAAA